MTVGRYAFPLFLLVLDFVDLKSFASVMAVKWHVIGVLFCILLFTRERRHLFVSFFAIGDFSLSVFSVGLFLLLGKVFYIF